MPTLLHCNNFFFTICFFSLLVCNISQAQTCDDTRPIKWVESFAAIPPKAIVLYAHGMNNNGDLFQELAKEMNKLGLIGALVTWHGHSQKISPYDALPANYATEWHKDLEAALCHIQARYPTTPLYYVGYSLGAAILLSSLQKNPQDNAIKKIAFIAPAVSFNKKAHLLRVTSFLPSSFPIPSLAEEQYHAHPSLPAQMYADFFPMLQKVIEKPVMQSRPLLLFLGPNDELISFGGAHQTLKNYFSEFKMVELDNRQAPLKRHFFHLIVDSNSLGQTQWSILLQELKTFFLDHVEQSPQPVR